MARAHPWRRRRMRIIARDHPDLFIDMVAVLDEEFWDDFFYRYGDQPEWLRERWHEAKLQVRFRAQGKSACWCGSARAYWHCCAERDEAYAGIVAAEEQDREWRMSLKPIPWWHPESGIDHFTRSAYEMYYIDSAHPFAIPPSECRFAVAERKMKTRRG